MTLWGHHTLTTPFFGLGLFGQGEVDDDGVPESVEQRPVAQWARLIGHCQRMPDLLGPQALVDPVLEHLDNGVRGHAAARGVKKEGSDGCHRVALHRCPRETWKTPGSGPGAGPFWVGTRDRETGVDRNVQNWIRFQLSDASAATRSPIAGTNLKPCPEHAEHTTTRPNRRRMKPSSGVVV